ncbi:MAG: hypothetical protein ACE5J2_03595 [Nitrososphaerales archaeon]
MELTSEVVAERMAPVIIIAVALVIAAPLAGLGPSQFETEPNTATTAFKNMVKHTNAFLWKSSLHFKNGFNTYAGENSVIDLDPDLLGERGIIFKANDEDKTFRITVTGIGIKSIEFSQESRIIMLENDGTEGMLKIEVPKELVVDEFTVKIDGQKTYFEISETETDLELLVYRPADSTVIFVVGTPEPILRYP